MSAGALVTWVVVALLAGLLLGAVAATLVARPPDRGPAPPGPPGRDAGGGRPSAAGAWPAFEVDDLPAFLEHPPGSPAPAGSTPAAPAPAAARPAAGATAVRATRPAGASGHAPDSPSPERTVTAMVVTAAVLVLVAVVIALVGGGGTPEEGAPSSPQPAPAGTAAASRGGGPPPGDMTARAAFGTVLLERRPAGVTVTRPGLSVSSQGQQTDAHVLLPTYNCMLPEPPADPETAGCAPAATEYADLSGSALQLTRDGDRLEVAGVFATYTHPLAGPPRYTGRSYRLSAVLTADGPELDGVAPATGRLRLGEASTTTTDEPGANVLELRR